MAFICSYSSLIYSRVIPEIFTRKNFAPTKYPRGKMLDPRNTHEKKFCSHEQEKPLDPRNTHEKKFRTHEILSRKKFRTHEILMRKSFRPTKHIGEKISDQRNIHEKKKFGSSKVRWHNCTRHMRPTMTQYPRNLAHSFLFRL